MNATSYRRSWRSAVLLVVLALVFSAFTVGTAGAESGAQAAGSVGQGASTVSTVSFRSTVSTGRVAPGALRLMNYFPASAGWEKMWSQYSPAQVNADFAAMQSLGANAVRLIVPPSEFGWPRVNQRSAANLRDAINQAAAHGLSVQLTLFDLWGLYGSVANSRTWTQSLLAPYRGDQRVALIELKNEIDPANPRAIAWARTMLGFLAQVAPGVPRTVSVRGLDGGANVGQLLSRVPSGLLDIIDLHLYGSVAGNADALRVATSHRPQRPVIVGEGGMASAPNPSASGDFAQAKYYSNLKTLVNSFGIASFAPWILSDLTPAGVRPGMPNSQRFFGLRRTNGTWKPASAIVRQMFSATRMGQAAWSGAAARSSQDSDQALTKEARPARGSTSYGYWQSTRSSDIGDAGIELSAGIAGSRALYLARTSGTANNVPAFHQEFPAIGCGTVSLSAYSRLINATGSTRISVAWFGRSGYLGQTESRPAINGNGASQLLSVSAGAIAGATSFSIHLKSAHNAGRAVFSRISVKCG